MILAEKPLQARLYGEAIKGTALQGATIVTAHGHLLRLEEPRDRGLTDWNGCDWPDLTIDARYLPKDDSARKSLKVIYRALASAETLIIATDPDREGEAIGWSIVDGAARRPSNVLRMLCGELNVEPIRKAFGELTLAEPHRRRGVAATVRSRIDLMAGTNLTVAASTALRPAGWQGGGPWTVGRVQTPVLKLVVDRDREIEAFRVQGHFALRLSVRVPHPDGTASALELVHTPEPHILDKPVASGLATQAVKAGPSTLVVRRKKEAVLPPRLFDKPTLLQAAGQRLRLAPTLATDLLQRLYEAGWVTYPRSDCKVISSTDAAAAPRTLATIARSAGTLKDAALQVARAGAVLRRGRVVDDKRVATAAHTAVIPTAAGGRGAVPAGAEDLYELIARRYIAALSADAVDTVSQAAVVLALDSDREFSASSRSQLSPGWRIAEPSAGGASQNASAPISPDIVNGCRAEHKACEIVNRRTEPPRRFTHATLVAAMVAAHKYVRDPDLASVLKEVTGLGQPSTIDQFADLLIRNGLIEERRRTKGQAELVSTSRGRALVDALVEIDPQIVLPDLTGRVELELRGIEAADDTADARRRAARILAAYAATIARWFTGIKAAQPAKIDSPPPTESRRASGPASSRKQTREWVGQKNRSRKNGSERPGGPKPTRAGAGAAKRHRSRPAAGGDTDRTADRQSTRGRPGSRPTATR